MATLNRKRRTYNRLLVICEIYGDDHILAALERARQRTIETTSRRNVARQRSGEREGTSAGQNKLVVSNTAVVVRPGAR